MSKRILSGLLAAAMLFTTAFAAEGDAAQPGGDSLIFAVTLPDGYGSDQLQPADADALLAVLGRRLSLLAEQGTVGIGATASIAEDGWTATVTLPESSSVPAAAEKLAAPGEPLAFTGADGTVYLTGRHVRAARVMAENVSDAVQGDLEAPFVQVDFTVAGVTAFHDMTEALAGQDEGGWTFTIQLGDTVLSAVSVDAAMDPLSWNIACGDLTALGAEEVAEQINFGQLPVGLAYTGTTQPEVEEPQPPAEPDTPASTFPDIEGHWARESLAKASELGLLKGVNGKMLPDNPVKRSEAIVILNRALGASETESTHGLSNVPPNAWYAADLGKAIHLGMIDADDSRNFDTASTRAEAFVLLARAFAYHGAGNARALYPFTDTGSMTAAQKDAAAALVSAGIVNGSTATSLAPDEPLTRAQFVTMLLRIAPNFPGEENELSELTGGALITAPAAELKDTQDSGDRIFACGTAEVKLSGVDTDGRVVLKGAEEVSLTAQNNTSIGVLALDPAGSASAKLQGDSAAGTVLVAGRGGRVSYQGKADKIAVTASGREIDLSGMEAGSLTITGSGNTIVMDGTAETVQVAGGAKNNTLTLNKAVGSLTVAGVNTTVDGKGKAEEVDIRAVGCDITLDAGSILEDIDPGLEGVGIEIGVPTSVKAGGALNTQIKFTGVTGEKVCRAEWYQDGKPIPGCANDNFVLTADKLSKHTSYFTFAKGMQKNVTIGFKLTYDNPSTGESEEIYRETTVPIENYSDEWYYQRDVNRVLSLVSSTYRGNYTADYAINNDYKPYEKEVWVNAKGYSSRSNYLLWINRAYQHVNVFTGSKGNWKLVHSFLVGTGAMSSPTPTGLTTVSYKSAGGWTTGSYTVRPVVGFYPGSGYAFHSRLCYPGTDREYDFSGGYPVSHGCVRMNKADVQWIYNNVPVGTAVVIF